MNKYKVLALSIALALSGCATVTMTENGSPVMSSLPDYEEKHDFFLGGLLPEVQTVYTIDLCPSGVRQLQTQTTFVDGIVSGITFGIYTPKTSKVWCKE